jgi:hypothetical protein
VCKSDDPDAPMTGFSAEDPGALIDPLEKIIPGIATRDPFPNKKGHRHRELAHNVLTAWSRKCLVRFSNYRYILAMIACWLQK